VKGFCDLTISPILGHSFDAARLDTLRRGMFALRNGAIIVNIWGGVAIVTAALTAGLIICHHMPLMRYMVVMPNPPFSHRVATPQGGGIATVAVAAVISALGDLE